MIQPKFDSKSSSQQFSGLFQQKTPKKAFGWKIAFFGHPRRVWLAVAGLMIVAMSVPVALAINNSRASKFDYLPEYGLVNESTDDERSIEKLLADASAPSTEEDRSDTSKTMPSSQKKLGVTDSDIGYLSKEPLSLGEKEPGIVQTLVKLVFALGIVFGLMALAVWFGKRFVPQSSAKIFGGGELQVLSSRALGSRQKLVIVKARHKTLLLGVTPHAINCLSELEDASIWSDTELEDAGLDVLPDDLKVKPSAVVDPKSSSHSMPESFPAKQTYGVA